MTYVTGQPIIFVGCGQVRESSLRRIFTPADLATLTRPTPTYANCACPTSFKLSSATDTYLSVCHLLSPWHSSHSIPYTPSHLTPSVHHCSYPTTATPLGLPLSSSSSARSRFLVSGFCFCSGKLKLDRRMFAFAFGLVELGSGPQPGLSKLRCLAEVVQNVRIILHSRQIDPKPKAQIRTTQRRHALLAASFVSDHGAT